MELEDQMVQAVLTWEADELRAGMRKIPGFAGHVTGLRHTMARTYGSATAEALNEGTECRQQFNSAVLGHRHDGFTTAGKSVCIFGSRIGYSLVLPPVNLISYD